MYYVHTAILISPPPHLADLYRGEISYSFCRAGKSIPLHADGPRVVTVDPSPVTSQGQKLCPLTAGTKDVHLLIVGTKIGLVAHWQDCAC